MVKQHSEKSLKGQDNPIKDPEDANFKTLPHTSPLQSQKWEQIQITNNQKIHCLSSSSSTNNQDAMSIPGNLSMMTSIKDNKSLLPSIIKESQKSSKCSKDYNKKSNLHININSNFVCPVSVPVHTQMKSTMSKY